MATFNEVSLRRKCQNAMAAKKFTDIAYSKAENKFDKNVNKLMTDFEEHEVTKELRYGGLSNNSELISKGNLFSFLGFYKDENPATDLKQYLKNTIEMDNKPKITIEQNKVLYGFKVKTPSMNQINNEPLFKLEWTGRSWIQIVEKGVGNAAKYIFWSLGFGSPPSRSGTGLQLTNGKEAKNPATFKPMTYVSELLQEFKEMFS